MKSSVYRTAVLQIIISVIAGVVAYALEGKAEAGAALYGGVVALIGTLLLLWRMQSNKHKTLKEAQQHLWLFYRSGVERFLVISIFLAIGMGTFKLVPLAVLVGFVASQLAWIIAPLQGENKSN
jgi:F0F1-type ATP synthase assembly protein I